MLVLLGQAADLAVASGSPADERLTAWRLAKAAYDLGTIDDLRMALDRVLSVEEPFAHHPPALDAAEPIARRLHDHIGYGDPRVPALWEAWRAHHRTSRDPWLEAQGAVQLAWHHACRWDLTTVRKLAEAYLALSPARFGRGPTKHPDAPDTTLSVYRVHADLTRILLRTAIWTGDEPTATEALELHLDALAASELRPERTPWTIDAWCRAADRFGWVRAPWVEWRDLLERWEQPHPVHAALGRAVRARRNGDPSTAAFDEASALAVERRAGWEWAVDALVEAERTEPDAVRAARIAELRARTSVGAAVG